MDIFVIEDGYLRYSPYFFQHCLSEALHDPALKILSAEFVSKVGVTKTTEMKYSGETKQIIGIDRYNLRFTSKGIEQTISVLVNSKTHYKVLVERLAEVIIKGGFTLSKSILCSYLEKTALYNTNMKDIDIFRIALKNPTFAKFLPKVYGTYVNDAKQEYMVIEEYLENDYVIRDYTDISFWDKHNIESAVSNLADFHAIWYDRYDQLVKEGWLGTVMTSLQMVALKPLWQAYAKELKTFVGSIFTQAQYDAHCQLVETVGDWWKHLDGMKKTLIYDDIQIRNLAMRSDKYKFRLELFDWEVPEIHVPQRDLIELLSYILDPNNVTDEEIANYIELNRRELEKISRISIDRTTWLAGCLYAMYDYYIDRLACQLMLHRVLVRPDITRVFHTSQRILHYLKNTLDVQS